RQGPRHPARRGTARTHRPRDGATLEGELVVCFLGNLPIRRGDLWRRVAPPPIGTNPESLENLAGQSAASGFDLPVTMTSIQPQKRQHAYERIDDPILANARLTIEFSLGNVVALDTVGGDDLDRQIRRAVEIALPRQAEARFLHERDDRL